MIRIWIVSIAMISIIDHIRKDKADHDGKDTNWINHKDKDWIDHDGKDRIDHDTEGTDGKDWINHDYMLTLIMTVSIHGIMVQSAIS